MGVTVVAQHVGEVVSCDRVDSSRPRHVSGVVSVLESTPLAQVRTVVLVGIPQSGVVSLNVARVVVAQKVCISVGLVRLNSTSPWSIGIIICIRLTWVERPPVRSLVQVVTEQCGVVCHQLVSRILLQQVAVCISRYWCNCSRPWRIV